MLLLVLGLACTRYDCAAGDCGDGVDSAARDSSSDSGGDSGDGAPAVVINDYLRLQKGHPENVVIISIDTLRRDHLNVFGYGTDVLPRHGIDVRGNTAVLDRFFEEGVGFWDHRSCSSWTLPSFVCLLTGMDQLHAGYWPYESDDDGDGVSELPQAPDELKLLPEYFHERGYRTMLVSGSGFLGESPNMQQGYDEGWGRFADSYDDGEEYKADYLVDLALEMLDDHAFEEAPFYLHLHLMEPHAPWIPPEDYMPDLASLPEVSADFSTEEGTTQVWRGFDAKSAQVQDALLQHMEYRYDMEVKYANDQVARVLDYLESHGLFEDTVVVLFTDHGEEFYEHGNFNHGYNSFDEVIRVQAAFYQPGNLLPARVDDLTLHQDVAPTLFALLGWERDPAWSGLLPGTDPPRAWVTNLVYRAEKTHQAATDGVQKLMFRWDDSDLLGGPKYFYDLLADPAEADNRYDPTDPDVLAWWDILLPEVEELDEREPHAEAIDPGP